MNKYTKAVNYLEDYLELVSPLLNEGELQFPEIESKLEYCIKMLKSNPFYEGELPVPQ